MLVGSADVLGLCGTHWFRAIDPTNDLLQSALRSGVFVVKRLAEPRDLLGQRLTDSLLLCDYTGKPAT